MRYQHSAFFRDCRPCALRGQRRGLPAINTDVKCPGRARGGRLLSERAPTPADSKRQIQSPYPGGKYIWLGEGGGGGGGVFMRRNRKCPCPQPSLAAARQRAG